MAPVNEAFRNAAIVRTLRLAHRIRQSPSTIDELAIAMNVTTRTVRRDLYVLQSVGFPVGTVTLHGLKHWRIIGPFPLLADPPAPEAWLRDRANQVGELT